MKRSLFGAAIAAGYMLAVSGTLKAEELSVRLDFSPWGMHAGMHLAQEKGWFEEEGLTVDVQDGRGSGNTLQLVNAGQVDVGQVQLGLLGGIREEGATTTSFAGFMPRTDLCVLVPEDSDIQAIEDLEGKSVVVFAASPWAPFIDPFLEAGGLDRNSAEVLFVDPAALWGTYTSGRADGLMSTYTSALPVAAGPRLSRCLMASDAGLEFPSYGLVATEETIEQRGEALEKLVRTQQRAWEHMKTNIDDGVQAIMNQRPDANLDPDILREQIRLTLDFLDTPATEGKPIGWQAEEDWNAALNSLERAGVVEAGWDPQDYYTNEFVE
ncbi:MAG: ABC transporter substrate-binding protein [bacterium]